MILLQELFFISSLFMICRAQTSTTLNTCANEKKVFKVDIRQRVSLLGEGSTIEDIDGYALCQEAYQYDYIWLHQLWTPSKYNYKNVNGQPQQTNDYRELQNIKEYLIDPQLGSLTNLYKFQQNVKQSCLHMKFLGEFSFYVPRDSDLMSNKTRFLRRPQYESPNIYSDRYDDDNFLQAMNDQMKQIPFAVPWNYLTLKGVQDMQDIIYRFIITQHRLDGIVFLQPSLGLYETVYQNYYPNEINDQGESTYLRDFYENIQLQRMPTQLYFMGGDDNSKYKSKLLNYLQLINGQPTPDNNWINANYTFYTSGSIVAVDGKSAKAAIANSFGAGVQQSVSSTKNSCIRFNFTNFNNGAGGVRLDNKGLYVILSGYTQDVFGSIYAYNYGKLPSEWNAAFNFGNQDIIEVQFEPQSYLVRYKKLFQENNQQASVYTDREPDYSKIRFATSVLGTSKITQIAFPFMFSQTYKHTNLAILGHRHIRLNANDPSNFYFGQVEPSINQAENNFTLNFYILYQKPNTQIGLGVCDRERVQMRNHQSLTSQGFGAYMIYTNGMTWYNKTINQDTGQDYGQGDLISVTFQKQNQSILYYKNKAFMFSFALVDTVKNLNFCVSMIGQYSTIYLEY